MSLTTLIAADSFHTKLCSKLSSSEVRFYTENGRFAYGLNFDWYRGR